MTKVTLIEKKIVNHRGRKYIVGAVKRTDYGNRAQIFAPLSLKPKLGEQYYLGKTKMKIAGMTHTRLVRNKSR